DGLNYYLATHPEVKPRLLTRFEPWMALSFTEGRIGGDIESVSLRGLEEFYGARDAGRGAGDPRTSSAEGRGPKAEGWRGGGEPGGSNGFAIAPKLTTSGHAMLLINPHTSFYFRPEVHVVSEEGLNAYGAVTWGQLFVYQGFNDRLGWMHTSGGGDVIDEYLETIVERGGQYFYRHGGRERPVVERRIGLPFKMPGGGMGRRVVTAYFTHHGPIVRAASGKWVAVRLMNDPVPALQQSYLRTKARSYAEFARVMQLRTNSSNNTVYADADGNIAYWHGNFVPRRDTSIDFRRPVDGSDPRTDWRGLHASTETIQLRNPASGWLQNTNNWPWTAAGRGSVDSTRYPRYMNEQPENARGVHALQVLDTLRDVTLDELIAAAYDTHLPALDSLIPGLVRDWDALRAGDSTKVRLAEPVDSLRRWNRRWSVSSVPTALAIYWAEELLSRSAGPARERRLQPFDHAVSTASPRERFDALTRAIERLTRDFGSWRTPWGEINRFQRLTGGIVQPHDDAKPSIPVGFPSATWGSLASFGQTGPRTTKRIYGNRGNSFVAAVEFGPRVRAKSILAGGVSGDPRSPHFTDQAAMYARGQFKDVLFHRDEVEKGAKRRYRPGER
ncbi:MAG TPA: penicillin acylase family protein, partial [Gemmatimonadaceae bacterium]|nr:penicillin acylase family protein [Gemmatimonadaceae bacterium]